MLQILDPHEDVCSEEGEQCNDYLRLRRLDISCVLKCIDCCCKVSLIRNVINATHIHTYTRIHAHNAHINTHVHVCMCVCVLFICVCVCIHVHTHSHIHRKAVGQQIYSERSFAIGTTLNSCIAFLTFVQF